MNGSPTESLNDRWGAAPSIPKCPQSLIFDTRASLLSYASWYTLCYMPYHVATFDKFVCLAENSPT